MSKLDDQIAAIKAKRDAAQLTLVRAQALKENAEEAKRVAMQRLQDEFGLDNIADARATLGELKAQVQNLMDEITEQLDEIDN